MKKMCVFILALSNFCISANSSHSAGYWVKTYGGNDTDVARFIQQTSDGGYVVAGYTRSFSSGDYDFWVLKLDNNGDVSWQKTYGGNSDDHATSIQQTIDGGYIVAGYTDSFGASNGDIWVLKLDSIGDVIWQKTYGGSDDDKAQSIQQTSDGGYIVTGSTESFGTGLADIWVLKLDSTGDIIWQKTNGGSHYESATSIQQTSDGGYVLAGYSYSFPFPVGKSNIWILKLDSNGDISWQKTYGGSNSDVASYIRQTSDGGYIVSGSTSSFNVEGIWVIKLYSNGDIDWQKTYKSSKGDDYVYSIQQTTDGGYIIAGEIVDIIFPGNDLWSLKLNGHRCRTCFSVFPSEDFQGNYLWLLKLDSNGNVSWQKTYIGGGFWDIGYSTLQTSDGGYIVAGFTQSFGAGKADIWVLRLDSNGEIPNCYIIGTSNLGVSDTDVEGKDSSAAIQPTFAIINDTNILPQDSVCEVTTVCDGSITTTTATNDTTTTTTVCPIEEMYGEYSKQTELLKYFRDNVLSNTPEGRELIKLYYQWCPAIIRAMEEDKEFKEKVKEMIDGVLDLIENQLE